MNYCKKQSKIITISLTLFFIVFGLFFNPSQVDARVAPHAASKKEVIEQLISKAVEDKKIKPEEADAFKKELLESGMDMGQLNSLHEDIKKALPDTCGPFEFLCHLRVWFDGVLEAIGRFFLKIASWILWAAGSLLNASIYFGVIKMGEYVTSSGNLNPILQAWTIFRDLINIFFIFGLLYISIVTVLKGWTQNTSTNMANIIMAALLINFSFFFTSILIDASNLLSLEIYKSMAVCTETEMDNNTTSTEWSEIVNGGISSCFMDSLGLMSIYTDASKAMRPGGDGSVDRIEQTALGVWGAKSGIERLAILSLASIFIIITAIVFFAAAVVVFARLLTLIILIILSPVMFLGMIVPHFKKYSDDWYKKLTDMLISMPVMFLFIYITYMMLVRNGGMLPQGDGIPVAEGNFSSLFVSGPESIGVLVNFVLILGMMIGSILVAQKTGAAGGDWAANFVKEKAGKFGGAVTMGLAAKLGRNTIGRAGNRLAESETMKKWANSDVKGWRGMAIRAAGKGAIKTGGAAAKSTFDARNTGAAAALASQTGINLGKAKTGGYAKTAADQQKAVAERNKTYGTELTNTDEAKIKATAQENAGKRADYQSIDSKIKEYENTKSNIEANINATKEKERQDLEIVKETLKSRLEALNQNDPGNTSAIEYEMNEANEKMAKIKSEAAEKVKPFEDDLKKYVDANESTYKDKQKQRTAIVKEEAVKALESIDNKGYKNNGIIGVINRASSKGRGVRNAAEKRVNEMYKDEKDKEREKQAKENAKAQKELEKEDGGGSSGGSGGGESGGSGGDKKKK